MRFFHKLFKVGNSYAVTQGDLLGQILIYVESTKTHKCFVTIPKMENLEIPKEVFDSGLKSGIVEFIERVPNDIRRKIKAQYQFNQGQNKKEL